MQQAAVLASGLQFLVSSFDSPWRLAVIGVAFEFALICVWSRRRTLALARAIWVGLAGWALLLSLSLIIQTPRERIIEWCQEMAQFVERGDVPAIMTRIDETFQTDDMDRAGFEQRMQKTLARYRIDRPVLRRFEFSVMDEHGAIVEFEAVCRVRTEDFTEDGVVSRWRIALIRRNGQWLAGRIEPLPVPLSPFSDWRKWLQAGN